MCLGPGEDTKLKLVAIHFEVGMIDKLYMKNYVDNIEKETLSIVAQIDKIVSTENLSHLQTNLDICDSKSDVWTQPAW